MISGQPGGGDAECGDAFCGMRKVRRHGGSCALHKPLRFCGRGEAVVSSDGGASQRDSERHDGTLQALTLFLLIVAEREHVLALIIHVHPECLYPL